MRRTHALIAVAAVAALLAGCGSSKSSSTTSSAQAPASTTSSATTTSTTSTTSTSSSATPSGPLTVAQWKQQINGICAGVTTQASRVPKPTDPAHLQAFVQTIVNIGNDEITKIKAVNAPAAFKAGQEAVVADLTAIYAGLQKILDRHLAPAQLSQAFNGYSASVKAPAQDYVNRSRAAGLTSCTVAGGA
jgi:hypothetical protein